MLSIRFDLVHSSIKPPLESQFVVIYVDKLHRHFNVSMFRFCLTVYSILTDSYEYKWRRDDDIYINRLNRCVHSYVPFSLFSIYICYTTLNDKYYFDN